MTTINFKGKASVDTYHLSVPFHHLTAPPKKSVLAKGANPSLHENMIIHGDNLSALKALLPTHAGKINCIYIDPPYNTGNENWVYNDNVNNPMIQEWLRKTVDREDLTRHDKWCCMMWPRLSLLRELLAEDGVIFISIDNNEQHRLRMMMDEIFGADNFVANIVVKSNPGGRDYGGIANTHDYILVYGKSDDAELNEIKQDEEQLPLCDEYGNFSVRELRNRNVKFNSENRPNLYYPFYVDPKKQDKNGLSKVSLTPKPGWVEVYPLKSGGVNTVWRWQKSTVLDAINKDIMAKKKTNGNGTYQIVEKYRKTTKRARSILDATECRNEQGTITLKQIFKGAAFDYPKSDLLLKLIVELGSKKDSVILDSFAGSGTTAHAVLRLNQEDGGNRKFILIECEDYADKVTAERVRRVIKGAPKAKEEELKRGLGGTFSYWELGAPIEMRNILDGDSLPSYEGLARYVFYTATGEQWSKDIMNKSCFLAGKSKHYEVYMFYKPNRNYLLETSLTLDLAKTLPKPGGKWRLVFAPTRFAAPDELARYKIKFCQLPFEIYSIIK